MYQTTAGSNHDYKVIEDESLLQPAYKKAPGSWKVNYTLDAVSKVMNHHSEHKDFCSDLHDSQN